jgi:hypothetical protein
MLNSLYYKVVLLTIFNYSLIKTIRNLLETQAGFWVLRPTQYVSQIRRTYLLGLATQNPVWVPTTQNAVKKRVYGCQIEDFIKVYINYITKIEFFMVFKAAYL